MARLGGENLETTAIRAQWTEKRDVLDAGLQELKRLKQSQPSLNGKAYMGPPPLSFSY
jgi:hypothetical protein